MNAIEEVFEDQNPDVDIINVTVKDSSSAKAVLARHMQEGDWYDPYDSFLVHAGHELIDTWVVAEKMEPVTFIFQENGWFNSYPEGVRNILSYEGKIWSVPVNVHRSNVLWYNKAVFEENGLTPPTTFDEFFDVAEKLQEKEVTPLALGDKEIWAATHLFESVLLGTMGPDKYRGLWDGSTDWGGSEVREALENFTRMIEYVNKDHAMRSWDEAAQLVPNKEKKAAMTIMGDWTHGYFTSLGLTPNVEYGWVPSPGTEGSFMMLADSFGLPKDAPNRENAIAWLKVVGSKEGQDAFNPKKGSIPARTDGDRNLYDVYQQSAMDDFASEQIEIVPSLVHGAAASEEWLDEINKVIGTLVMDEEIGTAQLKLVQACQHVGKCQ